VTHIYIKSSSNQRSTTSREASAAGRLRPNALAVTVKLPNRITSESPTNRELVVRMTNFAFAGFSLPKVRTGRVVHDNKTPVRQSSDGMSNVGGHNGNDAGRFSARKRRTIFTVDMPRRHVEPDPFV
jgi:hypothetical protein